MGISTRRINSRWFEDQFALNNVQQRHVAAWLKINPSGVSRILKGKRKLRMEEAAELAKRLALPFEEILVNAGIRSPDIASTLARQTSAAAASLPVTGTVDGQGRVRFEALKTPGRPLSAPNPGIAKKGIEVLRMVTAGTPLDGIDGGLIYYQPTPSITVDAIGRLCVVKLLPQASTREGVAGKKSNGPALSADSRLAVVKRGYRSGAFNLFSMGGELIETDVLLESASPVVWMKL